MVSEKWQRIVIFQGERFPTEWAMDHGDERDAGHAMPQSEHVRPRVPADKAVEPACAIQKET